MLDTGLWGKCHIQGIAVDEIKGFIYYSFTTKLVKARLSDGEIIGSVDGLLGHMGCIDFDPETGYVFGSLEYKHDIIGEGVLRAIGADLQPATGTTARLAYENAFYLAVFDVDKIDRPDMDAEKDSVMRTAYLSEVVEDYIGSGTDRNGNTAPHRYGCSGIDGTAVGPYRSLFVAYGIYDDPKRDDNDHQIILEYDLPSVIASARPLSQANLHHSGPEMIRKYFIYTGNTEWGIQNLEFDPVRKVFWAAVYPGHKPTFPNYSLFAIDAVARPFYGPLKGLSESGWQLPLANLGEKDPKTGTRGFFFPYGATGLYISGVNLPPLRWWNPRNVSTNRFFDDPSAEGLILISENYSQNGEYGSRIYPYQYDEKTPFVRK